MKKRPLLDSLRKKPRVHTIRTGYDETPIDDEQLAAYLDGRLSSDELDQFEAKAANSPAYCHELLCLDSRPTLDQPAEEAAIAAMRSVIASNVLASSATLPRRLANVPGWAKLVAVSVVAVIGILLIPLFGDRQQPDTVVVDRPPPSSSDPVEGQAQRGEGFAPPKASSNVAGAELRRPPVVPLSVETQDSRDIRVLPTNVRSPARAVAVTGLVLRRAANTWSAVQVGDDLTIATLAVPRGASCELLLGESRVFVFGGSKLTFTELSANGVDSTVRVAGRFDGSGRVRIENALVDSSIHWETGQPRPTVGVVARPNSSFGVLSDATETLGVVLDGAVTFGSTTVESDQSFRMSDGSLGPPAAVAWRQPSQPPWVISDETTQDLIAASDLLSALLAVTSGDDASVCTRLAIDLSDGPFVFQALARSESATQHDVLQDWLLAAPPSEIELKQAWAALGQSEVAVENWFTMWRRMRTMNRPPNVQRSSVDALLRGLPASQSRFVRESAVGILRELTRQPIASYDPAKPTTAGISEATRVANSFWTRYQRSRQPQRRSR